jgi:hypothetical protein
VKHRPFVPCLAVLTLGFSASSSAVTIVYEPTPAGGTRWTYAYYVSNDTLEDPLREFTVYFELGTYANLATAGAPPGWDPLVAQPDPDLPDDGFYDALAPEGGIPPDGFAVFSVAFDYLGPGTPGPQRFDVVDPVTLATIATGTTTPIPLPGTAGLLAAGIAAVVARAWRRPTVRRGA